MRRFFINAQVLHQGSGVAALVGCKRGGHDEGVAGLEQGGELRAGISGREIQLLAREGEEGHLVCCQLRGEGAGNEAVGAEDDDAGRNGGRSVEVRQHPRR